MILSLWPLDDTDWKLFNDLESMQDSGCHGNQKKKTLKIFLSKTTEPISIEFGRNVPLMIKIVQVMKIREKYGSQRTGLIFLIYLYKKFSCRQGAGLIFPVYLYRKI